MEWQASLTYQYLDIHKLSLYPSIPIYSMWSSTDVLVVVCVNCKRITVVYIQCKFVSALEC
jgi:hypothetical protein